MKIEITNLKKSFSKLSVLKSIDVSFDSGEVVALMGPNGSGKTTLLKSILGLIMPNEGEIKVMGESVKNNHTYRKHIGYMPQIARYPENLKVKELITMIRDLRGNPVDIDEELVIDFRIAELEEKALGSLSGGQKQRVGAALAFMFHPEIIILDEPTAGLDPVSTEQMKNKITKEKQKGKLIIITTHIMNEAEELADRLVYLMDGKIYLDTTVAKLKQETSETSLNKSIAKIIQGI